MAFLVCDRRPFCVAYTTRARAATDQIYLRTLLWPSADSSIYRGVGIGVRWRSAHLEYSKEEAVDGTTHKTTLERGVFFVVGLERVVERLCRKFGTDNLMMERLGSKTTHHPRSDQLDIASCLIHGTPVSE